MNPAAYLEMAKTESRHWWFCGRRNILRSTLSSLNLIPNAKILELGCGTGGNLRLLQNYGQVSAVEMNNLARETAIKKTNGTCDIRPGGAPDEIPFQGASFDLVCIFDVLEHIERDLDTLVSLKKLLKKNGIIILTVPAYQWLYGAHDVHLHHKRRYSAAQLRKVIMNADLIVQRMTYINMLLFPFIALVRLVERANESAQSIGVKLPPRILNALLGKIFSLEQYLLRNTNLPFGASILALVKTHD